MKDGGSGKANFPSGGVKKTGAIHQRVGSVPKPTGSVKSDGGGTCHSGKAGGSGGGKQTIASSRRTK
jgi:hypothetical protein